MSDTSGRTSAKQFAWFDPDSRSLKTWQGTFQKDSPPFSGTVPKTGCLSVGQLYELPKSVPHTDVNASSSLLPTPLSRDYKGASFDREDMSRLVNVVLKMGEARDSKGAPKDGFCNGSLPRDVQSLPEGSWGKYAAAVAHWETLTRPAPKPTAGQGGKPRIDPRFSEWMMGLPAGWVTDPEMGLPRIAQLKLLGNGVVPQQAELAIERLMCI